MTSLNSLLEKFRGHILTEFLQTCDDMSKKNAEIWRKIKVIHSDVDLTIEQIDYVNSMSQDEVLEEIVNTVRSLGFRKKFLDSL